MARTRTQRVGRNTRIRVTDLGLSQIRKNLEALGKKELLVGVQGQEAQAMDPEGVTNAQKALWNEFGTDTIPARSFINKPFRANRNKYRKLTLKMGNRLFSRSKFSPAQQLGRLGEVARADMVRAIDSGIPPANAESTIVQKGSSKTLIDTGALKQSITWAIR